MARGDVLSAAERIEAKFGNSIKKLGPKVLDLLPAISSGSLLLNEAMNDSKGYPEGCVVEAFGPQHSGKTLMGYLAIASFQKEHPDRPCLLIDAERQFMYQARWAKQLGVNVEELLYTTVTSAEEAFDKMEMMILGDVEMDKDKEVVRVVRPGNIGIIMIDSVSQLVPLEEINKSMDRSTRMAALASAMSRGLRKVVSAQSRANSKTTLFFINQTRANPNVMFGSRETRTGGNALAFYDTIAFRVSKVKDSEERDTKGKIISHRVKIKFEKNKTGSMPAEAIIFKIKYDGTGVDNSDELFTVAEMNSLITKIGHKYNFIDPATKDNTTPTILDPNIERFKQEDFQEVLEKYPKMKKMIMDFIREGAFYVKDSDVQEEAAVIDEEDVGAATKKEDNVVSNTEPQMTPEAAPVTVAPTEETTSGWPAEPVHRGRGRRRKSETDTDISSAPAAPGISNDEA